MTSRSRIDPLSWLIYIDAEEPASKTSWWHNPWDLAPVKRQLVHEMIHFWHSISTLQGLEMAFDALKSMNALRFAVKQGEDLSAISKDYTFEGYRPFGLMSKWQIPGAIGMLTIDGESERREPYISIINLYEGLARYWETAICETKEPAALIKILLAEEDLYGKAFQYTHSVIGDAAVVLFPIFAYIALNTEDEEVISGFDYMVQNFACDGFEVESDRNLDQVWLDAWEKVQAWPGVTIKPSGPMSSYNVEHRRFVKWKLKYAGLVPEDFSLNGHPILEGYIQRMMALAGRYRPYTSTKERETFIVPDFVLPGIQDHLTTLSTFFTPPMVRFNHAKQWITISDWYENGEAQFAKSMESFSALMGAAISLVQYELDHRPIPACGVKSCPLFNLRVCSQVIQLPESEHECFALHDISQEYGVFQEDVSKIPKPKEPILQNIERSGNNNGLVTLLEKINKIEKESPSDIVKLLGLAFFDLPAMYGGFWLFIEDHLNNNVISKGEFESGLNFVTSAISGISALYDASSGTEIQFSGHPMVNALMASVCFQVARKTGGKQNIEIAGALYWKSLQALNPIREQLTQLGIQYAHIDERLTHMLKDGEAIAMVEGKIRQFNSH